MDKIKIDGQSEDSTISLALDTIKIGKQAIVFVNTKRSAEKTAEEIAKCIKKSDKKLEELSETVLKALSSPTKQCERLSRCIKKGIAFHHAGLVYKQKELIENSFRDKTIKIICATPTLALGVDLPAFRAIIKDLRRYGHRGMQFIPVLEYLQMAGRAGRPNYDKEGQAIIVAATKPEKDKIHEKYILGEPEDVYSKLAVEPVLRTYLLSLIAADFINDKESILGFFERTFWAHQFKDLEKLEEIITRMLALLEDWGFLSSTSKSSDFQSGDEYGNEKYKASIMGKRVAELYIDPLTAHFFIECLKKAHNRTEAFSFLQMVSHTLEMRPLLKVRTKEHEKIEEALVSYHGCILEAEPSMYEYDEFLSSIKTALFMQNWIDEKGEEFILEEFNLRPGELHVKRDNADWLLYAAEELSRILKLKSLISEIIKLRLRLKYGVKEELLALLKMKNIGRVRARALFRNKIKDLADVKKADVTKLVQILGKKVALDIKKQVGIDIDKDKVPERKRKGQISLKDWQEKKAIKK
ncbi:helicase-related protein [Nanoarchaeota archaeon]